MRTRKYKPGGATGCASQPQNAKKMPEPTAVMASDTSVLATNTAVVESPLICSRKKLALLLKWRSDEITATNPTARMRNEASPQYGSR